MSWRFQPLGAQWPVHESDRGWTNDFDSIKAGACRMNSDHETTKSASTRVRSDASMDTRGRPALGPRTTGSHSGPHGYRPGYAKGARPGGGAWRPTRMRAIATMRVMKSQTQFATNRFVFIRVVIRGSETHVGLLSTAIISSTVKTPIYRGSHMQQVVSDLEHRYASTSSLAMV